MCHHCSIWPNLRRGLQADTAGSFMVSLLLLLEETASPYLFGLVWRRPCPRGQFQQGASIASCAKVSCIVSALRPKGRECHGSPDWRRRVSRLVSLVRVDWFQRGGSAGTFGEASSLPLDSEAEQRSGWMVSPQRTLSTIWGFD